MENYDKLKQIIQAANPEIMELKFGCKVKFGQPKHSYFGKGIILNKNYAGNWLIKTEVDTTTTIPDKEIKRILGRPIRLADVLLASFNTKEAYPENGVLIIVSKWNLSDDNLDHQSEETKQFLIDLLTH